MKQAVILAGGKGTRLKPLTASLPKPLVPVGDYPILEIILRQLARRGFRDVIISTGHLAELITAYCGNGKRWGLKIRYVREPRPLHTAGALRLIKGLKPHFLVINGDILTDLDFSALYRRHLQSEAWATLAICRRHTVVNYGVIKVNGGWTLDDYIEKPTYDYLVSMGINVFDRRVVGLIRPGEALGIPELVLRLKKSGRKIGCFKTTCEWLDIGRPDDYQAAQDLIEKTPSRFLHAR